MAPRTDWYCVLAAHDRAAPGMRAAVEPRIQGSAGLTRSSAERRTPPTARAPAGPPATPGQRSAAHPAPRDYAGSGPPASMGRPAAVVVIGGEHWHPSRVRAWQAHRCWSRRRCPASAGPSGRMPANTQPVDNLCATCCGHVDMPRSEGDSPVDKWSSAVDKPSAHGIPRRSGTLTQS